jgi:jmjN domain
VIEKCHVFFPTEDEFQNFMGYIEKCEKQVHSDGVFKVRLFKPNL